MRLQVIDHKINADSKPLQNVNYLAERIGFWAVVKEVDSRTNSVTVVSDSGYVYPGIPVLRREWVTVDNNKSYITGERNLPPVKSWVFVLTPTKSISGAFVLCSGYTKGDENTRNLWAKNENELEDKNSYREKKTQGGWNVQEEYQNGNFSAVNNDKTIQIIVNTVENNNKSQKKEVSLNAYGNKIVINEDGISLNDKNDNKVTADDNGIIIEDTNGNKIEFLSSGIKITDVNSNTITTGKNGLGEKLVTVNGHLTVKV